MIRLKELSKSFQSGDKLITVLDNVDLHLKEGAINVITGPSGSGKSTLLNIIGTLTFPDKGRIFIDGKDLSSLTKDDRAHFRAHKIGFVFQEFHLKPSITVKQNILLPLYFSGNSIPHEKLINLLKELGLENKINEKINDLSGGQKQRVAIARAIINNPKILIADEPTGNLDQKTGKSIIELFKKINKNHGTTIIIATHDEEITQIADKVFHLYNGNIQ